MDQEGIAFTDVVEHLLERGAPDHMCCLLGDWRGNGSIGLITGSFALPRAASGETAEQPLITIWERGQEQAQSE